MKKKSRIITLYESWAKEHCTSAEELPKSGSDRVYFRLKSISKNAIGVYNHDIKENKAFIHFSKQFLSAGMRVPEILAQNSEQDCYLISDLGEETLYDNLMQTRINDSFPPHLIPIYKRVLSDLVHFQLNAGTKLDYSLCYPRAKFDKQSIMWDLNYFKYYFLKLAEIPFNEELLENDYHNFADYLLSTDCEYFLYRDFQSRNIMLTDGKPSYIDYQGGRKGALQYDIASLLYDAKADIPESLREELLEYYISELQKQKTVDKKTFKQYFYGYVLIRIMQAMGAYGFRGLFEKKEHFIKSIPFAIANLKSLLQKVKFPIDLSYLLNRLEALTKSEKLEEIVKGKSKKLCVSINSFSYKRGIPVDKTDNGGGFVFDCRAIHNPGRYDKYKKLTGKDEAVINFFAQNSDIEEFLSPIKQLVSQSINVYQRRDFTHLQISFGCTGGRHRSVFSAEQIASYIKDNFKNIQIKIRHIEREMEAQDGK